MEPDTATTVVTPCCCRLVGLVCSRNALEAKLLASFLAFRPALFFFLFFFSSSFFFVSFRPSDDKALPPQEELRRGETPRRRVSPSSNQTARDLFKAHTAPCPAPAIPTSPTRGGHFPSTLSKYRSSTLSTHTPSFRLEVIPSRIRAPFPP
ncbi:hypothetical protein IWZ03DRAFT_61220 [Phyllosticta citriasiana]|uniref:Transmembrane protein n=1 Tax=Phyllosticta citriasiana TaxID=595635 RepID=A0ABR1KBA3_9PEZI